MNNAVSTLIHVPAANIVAIAVTFLIAVGVPVFLCVYIRQKFKAKISSFFIGCATFIIFALMLEQILHTVVFMAAGPALQQNIWLYALYGGLAAGIFEETGRFLSMKYMMKKSLNRENALMYGAGHGGVEAIILVGFTYLNNLLYSFMLNAGTMDSVISQDPALKIALEPLGTMAPTAFYMAGLERILAIGLHLALSMLVYMAVSRKEKIGYYFLAIGIHAGVNAVVVIVANFAPMLVAEIVCLAGVLAAAWIARKVWMESKTQ